MPYNKHHEKHLRPKTPFFGIMPLVILKVLSSRSMHGYQLAEELTRIFGREIPKPLVYVTLKRLEERGLVVSRWEMGESGLPRRIYQITDKGTNVLDRGLKRVEKFKRVLDFLLS